jgi:hypothetical protein
MARGGDGATFEMEIDFDDVERFSFTEETLVESFKSEVFDEVEVVGLTHSTDWETVQTIIVGTKLPMERESGNEHDANAIKVFYRGERIGWVAKEAAAQLAPMLDAGATATLKVTMVEEPYHEGNRRWIAGRIYGRIIVKVPVD